ncbi:MAG TPA: 2,3-bisphosphoglycerate-independent phosphoglycerate mutase, partial [bacterium]|nr:2,3-bisphosphoglycerate-independent phosphoglycerate mutase [bacterium]
HSAGHIATHESHELVNALNDELGSDRVSFYPGVSYRHLLVIKNGNNNIVCTPPHDVPGTQFREVLVKATKPDGQETAGLLNELIMKSQKVLQEHPVNQKRRTQGKDPANSLWPWAAGHKPQMKTLRELYGITGAVISAVDLIKGIGVYAGMKVMEVKGATGLHDTNYEGKARAAISALRDVDLVYLHIEASDEAGHEGNVALKIKTIELLDERVVKLIVSEVAKMSEPVTIAILPDHPTPCAVRTHTHDPVPFLIYRPSELGDAVSQYDEESVKAGSYGLLTGDGFMRALLNIESFNFVQDR